MGHMIQYFIGYPIIIKSVVAPLEQSTPVIVDLPQGFQCLLLCDNIISTIHSYMNNEINSEIEPFDFFDSSIKEYLEDVRTKGNHIYIETEYFGGKGAQFSSVFEDGQLLTTYKGRNDNIDVSEPYPYRLFDQSIKHYDN